MGQTVLSCTALSAQSSHATKWPQNKKAHSTSLLKQIRHFGFSAITVQQKFCINIISYLLHIKKYKNFTMRVKDLIYIVFTYCFFLPDSISFFLISRLWIWRWFGFFLFSSFNSIFFSFRSYKKKNSLLSLIRNGWKLVV